MVSAKQLVIIRYFLCDSQLIPNGIVEENSHFSKPAIIGKTELNHCFEMNPEIDSHTTTLEDTDGTCIRLKQTGYPYTQYYIPPDRKSIAIQGDYEMAGSYLTASEQYPHNLGEGKLYGATENDPQPDSIFYQGLAWLKLNELYKANALFHKLIRFGEDYYHVHITIDYFAVSLPDLLVFDVDLNEKNWIHCLYLMALGNTGLNQIAEANQFFDQILSLNPAHSGAKIHQNIAQFLKKIHQ